MNVNRVIVAGNLTRDPELRYTPSGQPVCNFSIAVNRRYESQGEKKEETTFLRVTVWGKQGEACQQYLTKGQSALVEGRLQVRNWEKDGQKHTATDVVAESVHFGDRKGQGGGQGRNQEPAHDAPIDDDIPL